MSYIKLKVRSGGIYIKQKEKYLPLDLDLTADTEENSQKTLFLIRESSIKGLFAYLMGETKKLKAIEISIEPSVQNLNSTLQAIVQASSYKKISEPHVTTFFERKDTHNKQSKFKPNPKINLYQHNFETADHTIRLLQTPLNNIIKNSEQSLGDIHSVFKNFIVKSNTKEYEKIKNDTEKLDLIKIPESALKKGIEVALQRIKDQKPISSMVIKLIEQISFLCATEKKFFEKIKNNKYGKFSVFTDLSNTKHWVNTEYHSIVRGTPAFIACVDFDIFLSQEAFKETQSSDSFTWEEIVQKLKNGPNIARWGEGGVVLLSYHLDEMGRGYDQKDQLFVAISALRKAGVKLKKYDWEKTADANKNKAEQKNKR